METKNIDINIEDIQEFLNCNTANDPFLDGFQKDEKIINSVSSHQLKNASEHILLQQEHKNIGKENENTLPYDWVFFNNGFRLNEIDISSIVSNENTINNNNIPYNHCISDIFYYLLDIDLIVMSLKQLIQDPPDEICQFVHGLKEDFISHNKIKIYIAINMEQRRIDGKVHEYPSFWSKSSSNKDNFIREYSKMSRDTWRAIHKLFSYLDIIPYIINLNKKLREIFRLPLNVNIEKLFIPFSKKNSVNIMNDKLKTEGLRINQVIGKVKVEVRDNNHIVSRYYPIPYYFEWNLQEISSDPVNILQRCLNHVPADRLIMFDSNFTNNNSINYLISRGYHFLLSFPNTFTVAKKLKKYQGDGIYYSCYDIKKHIQATSVHSNGNRCMYFITDCVDDTVVKNNNGELRPQVNMIYQKYSGGCDLFNQYHKQIVRKFRHYSENSVLWDWIFGLILISARTYYTIQEKHHIPLNPNCLEIIRDKLHIDSHQLVYIEKKSGNCVYCSKKKLNSKTKYRCSGCGVWLHLYKRNQNVECFQRYHGFCF